MILHHEVPKDRHCPCNWELDEMELDPCQASWRAAYKYACDNEKSVGRIPSEFLANCTIRDMCKECNCEWCSNLMSRNELLVDPQEKQILFDCHEGANAQHKINTYRVLKQLDDALKLANDTMVSNLRYP